MSRTGKIARNVLSTLCTQCVSWALTLVVTLYVPAYLKDTGLGALTLATSFAGMFSVGIGLGTGTVLIREVARDPSSVRSLLPAAIALRIALTPLACGAGMIMARALGYPASVERLIVIALLLTAWLSISDAIGSVLRGLEEFVWLNVASLIDKLLASALTIGLVLVRAPLWAFVAITGVGSTVSILMMLVRLSRTALPEASPLTTPRKRSLLAQMRQLVVAGAPFLTGALFVTIYGNSAPVLLGRMSGIAAVGWFGLAKRLAGTTLAIPIAITQAMLPVLARLYAEGDEAAFGAAVRRLTHLMLVSVMPFAVVLILAPGPILSLLHYPDSFRPSIPVLMTMGGAIVLWYLSQAVGTALIASDRQSTFSRVSGVAAATSIPLSALCIGMTEHFMRNGAVGAVLADVLMEAGMLWAYIRALPCGIVAGTDLSVCLRAAVAVLPTVGALYLAPTVGVPQISVSSSLSGKAMFLLLVGFGLLLYLPLCWLLRCFHPDDVQLLRRLGRRRVFA